MNYAVTLKPAEAATDACENDKSGCRLLFRTLRTNVLVCFPLSVLWVLSSLNRASIQLILYELPQDYGIDSSGSCAIQSAYYDFIVANFVSRKSCSTSSHGR